MSARSVNSRLNVGKGNKLIMTKVACKSICTDKQTIELGEEERAVSKLDRTMFFGSSWFAVEKASMFKHIDRRQENKDVIEFQKTGDIELFEKLYQDRIPSLKIWANRFHYLLDGNDDMFGELSACFFKAIEKYDKKRGSFNTCLYTFFRNCVRNLRNGKKAKKRKSFGADPNSLAVKPLSLDYNYSTSDGSTSTLKDIIADETAEDICTAEKMHLDETLGILSMENEMIREFLSKLSSGNTLSSLLKDLRRKRGRLKLNRVQAKQLIQKRRCKRMVTNIIKDKSTIDRRFNLVDYKVTPSNRLYYTVELDKTKAADLMLKTIRKLRKNENFFLDKIQG